MSPKGTKRDTDFLYSRIYDAIERIRSAIRQEDRSDSDAPPQPGSNREPQKGSVRFEPDRYSIEQAKEARRVAAELAERARKVREESKEACDRVTKRKERQLKSARAGKRSGSQG